MSYVLSLDNDNSDNELMWGESYVNSSGVSPIVSG